MSCTEDLVEQALRELLHPKTMSGEIRLKDVEGSV